MTFVLINANAKAPAHRKITPPQEYRVVAAFENRTMLVPAEDRTIILDLQRAA
tara:strand:+ start:1649 stop:1807 length:159 start_codon:yes stop_codon:yes gene_type:complete